jgi:aminotransferase
LQAWVSSAITSVDDTHTNIYGGAYYAYLIASGLAASSLPLKNYVLPGIAPPDLSVGIRRVHDFLTVGAAAPLQAAAVVALDFPDAYYRDLVDGYRARRDLLLPALRTAGFQLHEPAGAYYVMTDIADLARAGEDDVAFALRLIADPGVAAVPGSSFFSRPELGRTKLRFAFPKRHETLTAAAERLAGLAVRA